MKELSDKQWEKLKDLIPDGSKRKDGKGRPWRDKREVLDGILWVLRTGASWKDLPERYPPYQTCHRRFQQWMESGVIIKIIETLAIDLHDRGGVSLDECFINGAFCLITNHAYWLEKLSLTKASKCWQAEIIMVLFNMLQFTTLV